MFEINENARLRIKHVNDRRIIIIDDFYKNPDEIRNLALNSRERNAVKNNLPGTRLFVKTDEVKENLKSVFDKYCLSGMWSRHIDPYTYEMQWDDCGFMCNIMNDASILRDPWFSIPHQDAYPYSNDFLQFGVVIYLNKPEECAGGTNFYSYKGKMSVPYNIFKYMDKPEGFDEEIKSQEDVYPYIRRWLYGDREWKVEYEAKMRYNRCIFYEADILHSQNMEIGMFDSHDRINQIFFL